MSTNTLAPLLSFLKERHAGIMACETKALSALYENKDQQSYVEHLRRKALLVAALDGDAAGLTEALPQKLREETQDRLRSFSSSARNGLRIGSSFYYSALLYPDDHKAGEPDNLARLIAGLEAREV